MSKMSIRQSFEVVGSAPKIAAFMAWLEEGLVDLHGCPVVMLAQQLGLDVRRLSLSSSDLELDDSHVPE